MSNLPNIIKRIEHYRVRAHRKSRAHYLNSRRLGRFNRFFGVPVIVLSAIVGSSIFVGLIEDYDPRFKVVAGLMSLVALILSSLQTFFKFSELSENNKVAAAKYSSIYRALTYLKLKAEVDGVDENSVIEALEKEGAIWDALEEEAPVIPDRLYDAAVREQANDPDGV